jgi:hypothetical protein
VDEVFRKAYLAAGAAAGVAVLALLIVLVSVGGASAQSRQPDNGRGEPQDGFRAITRADNNGTVVIETGDVMVLRLGDDIDWEVRIDDASLLKSVPTFARDGQGTFMAVKAGETGIHATGGVHCDRGEACVLLAAEFNVHIVVR